MLSSDMDYLCVNTGDIDQRWNADVWRYLKPSHAPQRPPKSPLSISRLPHSPSTTYPVAHPSTFTNIESSLAAATNAGRATGHQPDAVAVTLADAALVAVVGLLLPVADLLTGSG